MSTLYDGSGNNLEMGGSKGFEVEDYSLYEDNKGLARQGVILYNNSRFYPVINPNQIKDKVKKYDSGIMFTLGDSYTAMLNNHFKSFAEKHGLVQDNRGLASSTIAGSQDKVTVGYHAFWVRLDEAITEYKAGKTINGKTYTCDDVKLITFMGGANDWTTIDESQGINRIGSGINETNKETLYGSLNYIFNKLLSTFVNADIVVILQPSNEAKGNANMRLKESIVREMAEMYGLSICDCIFNWYNPSNPNDAVKYWQSDKLHLNDIGNDELIKKLEYTVNNLTFTRN